MGSYPINFEQKERDMSVSEDTGVSEWVRGICGSSSKLNDALSGIQCEENNIGVF